MEKTKEIFKHIGRRNADRLRRLGVNRFETGDENILDILKRRAKKDLKVRMNIFLVQPGFPSAIMVKKVIFPTVSGCRNIFKRNMDC